MEDFMEDLTDFFMACPFNVELSRPLACLLACDVLPSSTCVFSMQVFFKFFLPLACLLACLLATLPF